MESLPFVSVLVPCRQEAEHIEACVESILAGDYPEDRLEVLIAEMVGEDRVASVEIVLRSNASSGIEPVRVDFEISADRDYKFSAWRELEVHRLTNEWVLSGQGSHFPLLHHWRTLPIAPGRMDNLFESWGDDAAIRRRVSSIDDATWSLVLFLEHLPQTLGQSMRDRLTHDPDPIAVVRETQAALLDILAFTGGQGLLHMDAHFENVLVDGSGGLFLGDHGLAISRTFELDGDEREFFKRHETFDRCTAFTSLVHAVVARYDARPVWREALRELIDGTHRASAEVSADLRAYLVRVGPLALAMGDFYRRLTADLRTEYPAASLQAMLDGA